MNKFCQLLLVGCLLLTVSCKQKGYPVPKHLLKPEEMTNILYDIHLSQATVNHLMSRRPDSLLVKSDEAYHAVLEKYQLEDSVLAKNIIYYSSSPKEYEKIYKALIERLNQKEEAVEKLLPSNQRKREEQRRKTRRKRE